MRAFVGALILSLCAWHTHHRAEDWRSDEALWSAARRTAPALARPAFNLGVALVKEARWEDATIQFLAAIQLYAAPSAWFDMQRHAGQGLALVDTLGSPVCDRPEVSPWCVWR